ncbi:ATP-binding cassette domain-containing protein [Candidatus Marinimicrobia bacterium]|nr:ATP-binding cassette domain-containing protein [Candidatus Neomarinimicrobiota bacterium]
MINLKNINKSFQTKDILKNISFKVNSGTALAIIGQSGVGKSVLLKHLNGLIMPDSGDIVIDKKTINLLSFNQLQEVRKNMSMVFQFGALFDSMTIRDNIMLALDHLTSLNQNEKNQRIEDCLQSVNLNDIENLYPNDISGGMKKRVGIARAIAIKPKYILYDEPTTGLDPITTDKIINLMKKVQKVNKLTSIIVTHEMKIVNEFATQVIMLKDGNIIFDGNPDELNSTKDKYIKYFILGKDII